MASSEVAVHEQDRSRDGWKIVTDSYLQQNPLIGSLLVAVDHCSGRFARQ